MPGSSRSRTNDVVGRPEGSLETFRSGLCGVDCEAFRFHPPSEEAKDPRLVLDDQQPHARADDHTADDLQMTVK